MSLDEGDRAVLNRIDKKLAVLTAGFEAHIREDERLHIAALDEHEKHDSRIKGLERTRAYALGAVAVLVAGVTILRDAIIAAIWGHQ